MQSLLFFLLLFLKCTLCILEDDKISNLPGLIFEVKYDMYSGYLDAKREKGKGNWKMFYWLTESKNNPDTDPLVVYFSGGPGCSSVGEAFEEMGPFYVNYGGETLYENIYSWNTNANVLFIDSPIGVGFSFDSSDIEYHSATDDQTSQQNYNALADFFERVQPKWKSRPLFITGSSYSGVYIPMVSQKIVEGINNGTFPNKNFEGFAIGNGYLNADYLNNALVLWSAYHAKISIRDWETMKDHCYNGNGMKNDMDSYDFAKFLKSTNGLDFTSDGSICGNLTEKLFEIPEDFDNYVYYEECYGSFQSEMTTKKRKNRMIPWKGGPNKDRRVNTAEILNYDSTDNQLGYPCWKEDAIWKWINREDVQKAFHIDPQWQKGTNGTRKYFEECNGAIYDQYSTPYSSMEPFLNKIITDVKNPNFRMLIYNGDIDTVCNYLGDATFMRKVALNNGYEEILTRPRWLFRGNSAGFNQRYTKGNMTIDVLTVKGAGHFVPNDRPGPSVQMLSNFIQHPFPDYSSTAHFNPTPTPAPLIKEKEQNKGTLSRDTSAFSLLFVICFLKM